MALPRKNYRKSLIILTLVYCIFVISFERYTAVEGEARIKEHAGIIADDLWNFNYTGAAEYLRLAAESDHYEKISVVDQSGEVFQELRTSIPTPAESLGIKLRLIPRVILITPIEHNNHYIGWIEAVWVPRTLLPHLSILCFLGLILLAIILYQRTFNEKINLEKRVAERTEELSRSNVQLKNEIHEREIAEQGLRRYEHIISATDDLMAYIDRDYRYQSVNSAYLSAHGKKREEIVGFTIEELFGHEAFHRIVKERFDRALSGQIIQYQSWFTYSGLGRKYMDVSYIPLKEDGSTVNGIVVTVHDLTKRHRAEEALREREEQFRDLVENINDVIFSVDKSGCLTYISPLFSVWTGYSQAKLLGKPFSDFVQEEDFPTPGNGRNLLPVALLGTQEFKITTQSGETRWVRSSGRTIENGESIAGLRGVLTDITERKQLEAQLIQAQKMEAVGTLAGGIAHDFNNLLMGIQGYVSLLFMEKGLGRDQRENLKRIEQYVQSGAGLTSQLLGLARGGKYEVLPTNLNKLIKKSAEIFGRTRKDIKIHEMYADDLWIVDADQQQIEQVLLNMYLNAWQAMPEGGEIFLQSENYHHTGDHAGLAELEHGEYIKLTIRDTGVGMDSETMKRIFDPFFTTKEVDRGTGLGLASAYGIIKNHGGLINVESKPSAGTKFTIYLPASQNEIKEELPRSNGILRGAETILLIDDEQMILEVSGQLLGSLGYKVITASSGPAAIDAYKNSKDRIGLVILDLVMPGMGGAEVFEQLKAVDPEVNVLLSSGYSIDGQAQALLENGCKAFIQKPFGLVELSHKLRSIFKEGEKPG